MDLKRRLLRDSRIYLILDRSVCGYHELFEITKKGLKFGVDVFQLRDKEGSARKIADFSKQTMKLLKGRALYIVNDRIDIALHCKADGVHLGQDDLPVRFARKLLGNKFLIGSSCQTYAHAKESQRAGADYIGFGSVFKTLTKPDRSPMNLSLLKKVNRDIKIPLFAIGGITPRKMDILDKCGVDKIAVCRAILESGNIKREIEEFKKYLS